MALRDDDVRYIPAATVVANEQNSHVEEGDLLFTRYSGNPEYVGACARVRHRVPNLLYPDKLIRGRVIPGLVDPGYLEVVISAPQTRAVIRHLIKTTAGQVGISGSDLRSVPVPLAPYCEQLRIVAAVEEQFSRLDAGVAALERAQQNIKRMLLALTAMADISNIQQGWRQVSLADVANIDSGPAFPSAVFKGPGEGIRLLRGDNIEPGALRWTNTRTWPLEMMQGFEHLHVRAGDLILAMDRPVIAGGLKLARVNADDLPALLVQRVARIRPASNINPRFLHIALMSPRFVPHLLLSQTGTQLPHITLAGIRSFPLVMPPQDVQMQVAEEFDSLSAQILDAQKAASITTERGTLLRKAILAAAFSGKLVSQDLKDEPASDVVERIAAERTSLNGHKPMRSREPRGPREEARG
jgi:type I restriction enzyme S subunit